MSDAFTRAHRAFNTTPQDRAAVGQGAFDDIPLDTAGFIAAVHMAYRIRLATKTPHPWRFLDVGCGGGMKVALAADFFDEAAGIKIDPGFAEAARQTFAAMGNRRCEEIAPYRTFAIRAEGLGCRHLGGQVHLKNPPDDAEFTALVAEVRRMGPHVYGVDQDPPRGLCWLRPLWLACAANGICPA